MAVGSGCSGRDREAERDLQMTAFGGLLSSGS
jgi:hypothetical protein